MIVNLTLQVHSHLDRLEFKNRFIELDLEFNLN